MKNKLVFLAFLFTSSLTGRTQTAEPGLKPFKVDISVGYASPGGKGTKGGVLFAIEPKYAVVPALSLGLRMEAAVVARVNGYRTNGAFSDATVQGAGSYLATADFYFRDHYPLRPFAGAGAGIYTLAGGALDDYITGMNWGNEFGGMIRAGFEARHFRFGIEYNLVPNTRFDGLDNNGDPASLTSHNSYLGLKLGICIGGGPR
jgi:hypothetical protein